MEIAKERDHVSTNERHVHIARSWTVSVERLVCFPFMSRHRASAKNDFHAVRCRLTEETHEFVVAALVAAKHQSDHTLADGALIRLVFGGDQRRYDEFVRLLGEST